MLNANARSKAKLPICAMWENPNVFFQKPRVQATGTARIRRLALGEAKLAAEIGMNARTKRKGRLEGTCPPGTGGRGSAARRFQRADAMRCADDSVGESRAPQPASPRIRGLVQIRDAPTAGRRGGGLHPPH